MYTKCTVLHDSIAAIQLFQNCIVQKNKISLYLFGSVKHLQIKQVCYPIPLFCQMDMCCIMHRIMVENDSPVVIGHLF